MKNALRQKIIAGLMAAWIPAVSAAGTLADKIDKIRDKVKANPTSVLSGKDATKTYVLDKTIGGVAYSIEVGDNYIGIAARSDKRSSFCYDIAPYSDIDSVTVVEGNVNRNDAGLIRAESLVDYFALAEHVSVSGLMKRKSKAHTKAFQNRSMYFVNHKDNKVYVYDFETGRNGEVSGAEILQKIYAGRVNMAEKVLEK